MAIRIFHRPAQTVVEDDGDGTTWRRPELEVVFERQMAWRDHTGRARVRDFYVLTVDGQAHEFGPRWFVMAEATRVAQLDPYGGPWWAQKPTALERRREDRPDLVPHRQRLFETIRETRRLDWMLLTKRPESLGKMLPWMIDGSDPWPNVWIGATGEDDKHARERSAALAGIRAAVKFMSYEPALGDVAWEHVLPGVIDWLIIGGESGTGAREFHVEWARKALAAARRFGVAPFVKQMGRFPRDGGQLVQLRLDRKKGGNPEEWDPALRVREYPTPLAA